eukprot:UN04270
MVCLTNVIANTLPTIHSFAPSRGIFIREYRIKMYGIIPYFFVKVLLDSTLSLIILLPCFMCVYFYVG